MNDLACATLLGTFAMPLRKALEKEGLLLPNPGCPDVDEMASAAMRLSQSLLRSIHIIESSLAELKKTATADAPAIAQKQSEIDLLSGNMRIPLQIVAASIEDAFAQDNWFFIAPLVKDVAQGFPVVRDALDNLNVLRCSEVASFDAGQARFQSLHPCDGRETFSSRLTFIRQCRVNQTLRAIEQMHQVASRLKLLQGRGNA